MPTLRRIHVLWHLYLFCGMLFTPLTCSRVLAVDWCATLLFYGLLVCTGSCHGLYVLYALLGGRGVVYFWLRAPEEQRQAAMVPQTVRI